jgi:uncharacterized membrane protein
MHGKVPSQFFSTSEKQEIQRAIARAERKTSGEIRVHLVRDFPKGVDPLQAGKDIFEKLGMTATEERSGILFLLELKHHQLVILGDKGIHEKVTESFWREIRDTVLEGFSQQDFSGGIVRGIERCGEKLQEYFPSNREDVNELSDEITQQ